MRGGDLNIRPFALAADFLAAISSAAISEAANDRQATQFVLCTYRFTLVSCDFMHCWCTTRISPWATIFGLYFST